MYGGLFGDLPSTKKGANSDGDDTTKNNRHDDPVSTSADSEKNQRISKSTNVRTSFLQTVGKSGTTMAFVPAAALKAKKRKNPTEPKPSPLEKNSVSKALPKASSFARSLETTTTIRTKPKNENKPIQSVVDIHGGLSMVEKHHHESLPETKTTEIDDPYDPFVPNDLLDYWETLAAKKHREHLEQETQQALEHQQELRKQLEAERSKMLEDCLSGGSALVGMGRGRGRGVSNLPAWLVEKQRKEASEALGSL